VLLGLVLGLPFVSKDALSLELSALFEKLPHLTLPFSLAKSGYVLTTDFEAGGNFKKSYLYTFHLSFLVNNDNFGQLSKLLGFGATPNSDGASRDDDGSIRAGIAIPLKLNIARLDGKNEIAVFSKEYNKLAAGGAGDSKLFTSIDHIRLDPGTYRVRLEALTAVPELANVPVNFEIGLPGKH